MKFIRSGSLAVFLTIFALPAWPQASTTTIRGTVQDQSKAVIPNASVELTNTATNVTVQTTTNEVGFYLFLGVVPGPYRLTVEAPGMQKYEATLTAQVQQEAVVNAKLNVGRTDTTVMVDDVTPMINIGNPTLGHVLERRRIEQLPINGRSILNLLVTIPGLEPANDYGSDGTRAYGIRQGSHEFVLDGAALTERMWGGIQRRPPGLDTIEEFKVENNNSSARFTRPMTVVMSSKSGTNRFTAPPLRHTATTRSVRRGAGRIFTRSHQN